MSRQINLYNPELLDQGDWLTARLFVRIQLGLAVLLLGGCLALAYQLHSGRQQLQETQAQLTQAQQQLAAQTVALQAKKKNEGLLLQRRQVEQAADQHQRVLASLTAGLAAHPPGYAGYMQALARQSFDGLWLTGFEITPDGRMNISGQALKPELLSQYIARLKREPILQGKAFDYLDMGRPAPLKTSGGVDAQQAAGSGAIAFSLHSKQAEKGR